MKKVISYTSEIFITYIWTFKIFVSLKIIVGVSPAVVNLRRHHIVLEIPSVHKTLVDTTHNNGIQHKGLFKSLYNGRLVHSETNSTSSVSIQPYRDYKAKIT